MPNGEPRRDSRYVRVRSVDTGGVATEELINKQPTELCWIVVSPETAGSKGKIQCFDGFDDGGKQVLQMEPAYTRDPSFEPPIPCNEGLFIKADAAVACWSVGYRLILPVCSD